MYALYLFYIDKKKWFLPHCHVLLLIFCFLNYLSTQAWSKCWPWAWYVQLMVGGLERNIQIKDEIRLMDCSWEKVNALTVEE